MSVAIPQTGIQLMPPPPGLSGQLGDRVIFIYLWNRMHHVHFHRHGAPQTPRGIQCVTPSDGQMKNGEQSGADKSPKLWILLPCAVMDVRESVALPAAPGPPPSLQPIRRGDRCTRKPFLPTVNLATDQRLTKT